jgi:hypothetical protein
LVVTGLIAIHHHNPATAGQSDLNIGFIGVDEHGNGFPIIAVGVVVEGVGYDIGRVGFDEVEVGFNVGGLWSCGKPDELCAT